MVSFVLASRLTLVVPRLLRLRPATEHRASRALRLRATRAVGWVHTANCKSTTVPPPPEVLHAIASTAPSSQAQALPLRLPLTAPVCVQNPPASPFPLSLPPSHLDFSPQPLLFQPLQPPQALAFVRAHTLFTHNALLRSHLSPRRRRRRRPGRWCHRLHPLWPHHC